MRGPGRHVLHLFGGLFLLLLLDLSVMVCCGGVLLIETFLHLEVVGGFARLQAVEPLIRGHRPFVCDCTGKGPSCQTVLDGGLLKISHA